MKIVITIDCLNKPNPGTLNHLAALITNPSNKNQITVTEYD